MNLLRAFGRRRKGPRADGGFTLVEVLIALVLSGLVGGVVVAALFTSLNVDRSTTDQVRDSNDAGLISAFLIRDAQSAGATSPTTALRDPLVGVSVDPLAVATTPSAIGWSGCAQQGTMVVRFSWLDRTAVSAQTTVVTYALDSNAQLIRKICKGATNTETVVGSHISHAAATCTPLPAPPALPCDGVPTRVALTVDGLGTRAPLHYVLNASVRTDTEATPTSANAMAVPLLTIGPTTLCPSLDIAGTGTTTVIGNVLIDGKCGAAPIAGNQNLVRPTGVMSSSSAIVDPFLGRQPPSSTGCTGGVNPPTIGASPSSGSVVVYPQAVNLVADTNFAPGRYVFCNGLDMTIGKITGTDVLLYVAGGSMAIRAEATLDMTGRLSGGDQSLLIWLATPNQTMTIAEGPNVSNLRGVVYAPTARIELSSVSATNIGGLIGKEVRVTGAGTARFGLPIPSMTISPPTLPAGRVGDAYSTPLSVVGGTAPYSWSATGLPQGVSIAPSTGLISGTPTVPGVSAIIVAVVDATGASTSINYSLAVTSALGIFSGSSDVGSTGRPGDSAYTQADDTYTVSVGKGGVGGTSDGFQFIYRAMTGDGRLTARVVSLSSNDGGAQAGVMFRETLDQASSEAMTDITLANGGEFLFRNGAGAPTNVVTNGSPPAPYWVRLTRVGSLFTAEWSADGVTWVGIQQTSVAMASTIYVGLAVATHNNSANLTTATFDHVAITVPPPAAPVIAATAATLPYTENGTTALDAGLTVNDADTANLGSATVRMTTNYANGQDALAFVNQNGITGTWTAATGVLSLSGTSTVANYQTALRSITYHNNSDNPTTATRTVTFVANDGVLDSNVASRTITLTAVDDAPVVTATATSLAYVENGTSVLDPSITVTDVDSGNLSSATVSMTTAYVNGQDTLAFVNQNGITGTWTAATGVLALSGNTTVANYEAALRSITYTNSSNMPSTATRTVTFVANDGAAASNIASRTITITVVNDAPVVTASGGSMAYTENGTTPVDPAITVTDVDSATLAAATVDMTTGYLVGEDSLSFVNQNGIVGTWNAATGVLSLSGSSTVANYQAAMRSITYNNNSHTPNTATRTVTFVVNDGGLDSNVASRTIAVSAANDAPVNGVPGNQATAKNTARVFSALNGNLISISDVDAGSNPVRVQLVSTQGTTTLSGIAGLTFTAGDGTADTTMTFTGTIANINVALAGLSFNPTLNYVGAAASLQVVTNDLGNSPAPALGDTDTIAITVANAPVVTATGTMAYTENGTTAVASAATVTDADSATLASAKVTMTTNYVNGQDTLAFTTQNGITGTWTPATGVLALSGSATLANYQTALRSITYNNNSNTPSTLARTVTFVVNDGLLDSNVSSRTITVAAVNDIPVIAPATGTMAYTENATTVLDAAITVTDADNANLASATISMTTNKVVAQDVLGFVNQNGITGSFNAATGVLTLTGSSSVANYQAALRSVTYNNNSNTPTTTTRTVSIVVNDGAANSTAVTRTITLTAVNDAPVNGVPGSQATAKNVAKTFSAANGNLISISDVDAGVAIVQVTLTATNGTITLPVKTGLTFTAGDGTADATMTFTGTIANINLRLNGLIFTPTNNFVGTAMIQIATSDLGNSPAPAATDTDAVFITVT